MVKLKCWKKVEGRKGLYRKKYIGSGYFEKIPTEITITHNKPIGKYNVAVWTNLDSLKKEKLFKTRSQAIKFANSYMQKHDKC